MHAGKLSNSPRLQRLLSILKAHPDGMTTMQLVQWTGSCAVHSDVAELRAEPNLIPVACEYQGKRDGRRIYLYRVEDSDRSLAAMV